MDTAPKEELKIVEISTLPAEIVRFTEALEEGRAIMVRRDAIVRDESDEEVRRQEHIPRNAKNNLGSMFPDEEVGPEVDTDLLLLANRLQWKS